MKKELIYFEIPGEGILGKFKSYFSSRFLPKVMVNKLLAISPKEYPAYIKIDGSDLELVPSTDALQYPDNIIKVRNLERIVVTGEVEKVVKQHIDLYPKFKRSNWNSGKVGFVVKSDEDLVHLFSTVLGGKSYHIAKSVLQATGSVILFVKEGNTMVCVKSSEGIEPVKGLCQMFNVKVDKANFVDYTKEFALSSPIEFY